MSYVLMLTKRPRCAAKPSYYPSLLPMAIALRIRRVFLSEWLLSQSSSVSSRIKLNSESLSIKDHAHELLSVEFLGTGSAVPLPWRHCSSMNVRSSSGVSILVDCGEGTQLQMAKSAHTKAGSVDWILLTHLHGDHWFGLPGILSTAALNGRKKPINVVGPIGIFEMITNVMEKSGGFDAFDVHVMEMDVNNKETHLTDVSIEKNGLKITAKPIKHRIDTFGYIVAEQERPKTLCAEKARAMGAKDEHMKVLKSGNDVKIGEKIIRAEEVLKEGRKARKVAILQDTCDSEEALEACQGCNALIHEATFHEEMHQKAIETGHSTAAMAASFAARCGAQHLFLTHFSSRYGRDDNANGSTINGKNSEKSRLTVDILRQEAANALQASNATNCTVTCAEDFMRIVFKREAMEVERNVST